MSISFTIREALKSYDIREDEVKEIEVAGQDGIIVHLLNGKTVSITDPSLNLLAKYSKLDFTEEHRKHILKRLYGIDRIYFNYKEPFSVWQEEHKHTPLEKLKNDVIRYEKELGIGSRFREYVIIDLSNEILKKSSVYPIGLDSELEKLSTLNLLELYSDISDTDFIVGFEFLEDKIVFYKD